MKLNQNILADFFQSGMILPLNKDFKLGGLVNPKEKVTVFFDENEYTTISDQKGNWQITLNSNPDPNLVAKIVVRSGNVQQTINNVKFGRIYLLSGQSNIEYRLKDEKHFSEVKKYLQDGKLKDLYYYNVPQVDYIDPRNGEIKPLDLKYENWQEVSADNCGMMSAIGFYMLKSMREHGVKGPLAIVDCYKGGTSASVWIKQKDLANDPELNKKFLVKYHEEIDGKNWSDFDHETDSYNKKVDQHNKELARYLKMHPDVSLSTAKNIVGHTPWPPPARPDLYTRPCGLHETMMDQVKYGVFNKLIWYQGENDTDRSEQYRKLLPLLIHTWRRKLNDPSLPVKIIQLPGYADYPENSGAVIRQTQLNVALNLPNVDMISFIDGGEEHNIHPTNKKIMGERLGKIMTGSNYGGTPFVDKISYKNGELILNVQRCERLKLLKKVELLVKIDHENKKIEVKEDNLNQNQIILKFKERPSMVSYAYCNFPKNIGLYNELNYPVSPFKVLL